MADAERRLVPRRCGGAVEVDMPGATAEDMEDRRSLDEAAAPDLSRAVIVVLRLKS
jgi:hypothetical protein